MIKTLAWSKLESFANSTLNVAEMMQLLFNPITRWQILDSFKLKDFADDSSKFEENWRKLFKLVENTVGKGEIARYKQFLLFPQCFQKASFRGASKGVIVWELVNSKENIVGNGKKYWLPVFLSFSHNVFKWHLSQMS